MLEFRAFYEDVGGTYWVCTSDIRVLQTRALVYFANVPLRGVSSIFRSMIFNLSIMSFFFIKKPPTKLVRGKGDIKAGLV